MGSRKKIVLVHYHLKKGGVTTVIREQSEALKKNHDLLILTGETPEVYVHENYSVIPELGYDRLMEGREPPERTSAKILAAVEKHFGSPCDIMHFHNPILAKNRNLLKIINIIRNHGNHVFLQIHDFAEDGRPDSYFKEEYPKDVHYGVINTRDYEYFLNSGLKEEGLHFLPNCVPFNCGGEEESRLRRLILYPVRAIRRKNIGEILLLSLFLKKRDYIGVTLPALNSNDLKSYEDWKILSGKLNLNVEFDIGLKYDYRSLIGKSKFILTTSITEGFGFSYIEPWICGKALFGRMVPDICRDFTSNGMDLSGLYNQLLIPSEWIDREYYLSKIKAELESAGKYYGLSLDEEKFIEYFALLLKSGAVNFGLLSEKIQEDLILFVMKSEMLMKKILEMNPKLSFLSSGTIRPKTIQNNKAVVENQYSRKVYAVRLNEIYNRISAEPIKQKVNKSDLLNCFLQPQNFYMLKWGAYDR